MDGVTSREMKERTQEAQGWYAAKARVGLEVAVGQEDDQRVVGADRECETMKKVSRIIWKRTKEGDTGTVYWHPEAAARNSLTTSTSHSPTLAADSR